MLKKLGFTINGEVHLIPYPPPGSWVNEFKLILNVGTRNVSLYSTTSETFLLFIFPEWTLYKSLGTISFMMINLV